MGIQKDSKNTKHRIVNLCKNFMKSFEFVKQGSFDTRNFPSVEASRGYAIVLRLMKMKQMFNFGGKFALTEERNDEALRGHNVVRFRDKRLAVFSKESYRFLESVHSLIENGVVDVKSMYICCDHKILKKKNEEGKKERRIQGLLWYIVFTDDSNAETFLKECVKKCSEDHDLEKMYRKEASKKKNATRDHQQKRDMLRGKWTQKEFKKQQEMYHFGLALVGGEFKSKPETHLIDHNLQKTGNNFFDGC